MSPRCAATPVVMPAMVPDISKTLELATEAVSVSCGVDIEPSLTSAASVELAWAESPLSCCQVVLIHAGQEGGRFSWPGDVDADLVARAKQYVVCRQGRLEPPPHSDDAWLQFYQECQPLVISVIRRGGVKRGDSEDCAQQVWQVISQHLSGFSYDPARGRFRDWFALVVRREVRRYRRRCAKQWLREQALNFAALPDRTGADPVAEYGRNELQQRVREALNIFHMRLSVLNYLVLHAHWWQGESLAEIAPALGLSESQVRWRLRRIQQKLRTFLRSYPELAPP